MYAAGRSVRTETCGPAAPLSAADRATLTKVSGDVATEWAQNLDKRGKSGTEVLEAFKAGLKK